MSNQNTFVVSLVKIESSFKFFDKILLNHTKKFKETKKTSETKLKFLKKSAKYIQNQKVQLLKIIST